MIIWPANFRLTRQCLQQIRAGTPIIVRDEKDGSRAVLWAPGDED
jgi:hypothetical protein